MDRATILALPAGPELDALVAEKVLGWSDVQSVDRSVWWGLRPGVVSVRREPLGHTGYERVPAFSTDVAAAWELVEHFAAMEKDKAFKDTYTDLTIGSSGWRVAFPSGDAWVYAFGETMPLAVCRAAVQTLEG